MIRALLLTGLALFAYVAAQDNQIEKDVKSGKLSLFCEMNDGYRKINGDDVVAFDDKWIFKNGSASNCEVK